MKVINGKVYTDEQAAQMQGGQQSSPLQNLIPQATQSAQPAPQNKLVTPQDPNIVLNTLAGFIPGGQNFMGTISKQFQSLKSGDIPSAVKSAVEYKQTQPSAVGSDLLKMITGLPGFVAQPIAAPILQGIEGLTGKPAEFLGLKSYSGLQRDIKAAGGGEALSVAMPLVQNLMALGMMKSGISKGDVKPVESPTVEPKIDILDTIKKEAIKTGDETAALAIENVKKTAAEQVKTMNEKISAPTVSDPLIDDNTLKITDKGVDFNKPGKIEQFLRKSIITPVEEKIKLYDGGQELVSKLRRTQNQSSLYLQQAKQGLTDFVTSLTEEESKNLKDLMEGKSPAMNDKVTSAGKWLKTTFEEYSQAIFGEAEKRQNYFPRSLNEEGVKWVQSLNENSDFVKKISEERGMSIADAIDYVQNIIPRKGFEMERTFETIPEQYLKSPKDTLISYFNSASQRRSVIENLGQAGGKVDDLLGRIRSSISDPKERMFVENMVKTKYLDPVMGKIDPSLYSYEADMSKYLTNLANVRNLSFKSTVNDFFHSTIESLKFTPKAAIDMFNKRADPIIKEMGINDIFNQENTRMTGTDFKSQGSFWDNIGQKYLNLLFGKTGERNIKISGRTSYESIISDFQKLIQDPTNEQSRMIMKERGMLLDDKVMDKAIRTKEIPKDEMAIGVIDGIQKRMFSYLHGDRPEWARTPLGRPFYSLMHATTGSTRNTFDMFARDPKWALTYLAIVPPLIGMPIVIARTSMDALMGKNTAPKNIIDLWFQSVTETAFPLASKIKSMTNMVYGSKSALGGYGQLMSILSNLGQGKVVKAGYEAAPIPAGNIIEPILFPSKKK